MPIITDSIVDVGNYTTFNVGLSKSISNYTAEEVWDYPYCSSQWEYYKHIGHFDTKPLMDFAPGGTGEDTNKLFPLKYTGRNEMYYPQTYWFDPGEITYNTPDGIYCRVIWLYGTDGQISNLLTNKRRSIYATDGFKIVTQMDMTKVFLFLDNFVFEPYSNNANVNNINTLTYDNFKIKEDHDDTTSYTHPRDCSIFPAVMFKYNDKLYVHMLFQRGYVSLDWAWGLNAEQTTDPNHAQGWEWDAQPTSFDGTEGCYLPVNIARDFAGLRPQSVENFHTATDIPEIGAMYQWYYNTQTGGRLNPVTEDAYLKLASWYGGMFHHNGKYYKPVIKDGYVTGYTDDMTYPSDIDNWTGDTRHDVPPGPPTPPEPDLSEWDNISLNGAVLGGANAFCRVYYCTQSELTSLKAWTMGTGSGDPVPGGFDPSGNFIGLMMFPFTISGSGPDEIKFTTTGGIDPVTTQQMPRVLNTGVACESGKGDPVLTLSTAISVPSPCKNKGEPWLDYNSYIELYIPFCGIFELDPQAVIGRTVNIRLYTDVISGTCAGYASAVHNGSECIVAQGTGSPGVQIPISIGNYGLAQAARVQNTIGSVTGQASSMGQSLVYNQTVNGGYNREMFQARAQRVLGTTPSARESVARFNSTSVKSLGGAMAGISGILGGIQHWVSARTLANSASTSAVGGFSGSMAEWCGVFTPYIKMVIPRWRKPDTYKHTCAEPDVTTRSLKSCSGFCICSNPDTSDISATEAEKSVIYQLLSTGVYV